jgi:hypothetical protein
MPHVITLQPRFSGMRVLSLGRLTRLRQDPWTPERVHELEDRFIPLAQEKLGAGTDIKVEGFREPDGNVNQEGLIGYKDGHRERFPYKIVYLTTNGPRKTTKPFDDKLQEAASAVLKTLGLDAKEVEHCFVREGFLDDDDGIWLTGKQVHEPDYSPSDTTVVVKGRTGDFITNEQYFNRVTGAWEGGYYTAWGGT